VNYSLPIVKAFKVSCG